MDINIETNKVKLTEANRVDIENLIKKKYDQYPFIKTMEVLISQSDDKEIKVSLKTKPEKGKMLFASDTGKELLPVINHCRNKLDFQIERYKEVHYKTSHKASKNRGS